MLHVTPKNKNNFKNKKNKILLMLHVTRYTFLKITIKIGLIEFF